jgi:hypothetical protein
MDTVAGVPLFWPALALASGLLASIGGGMLGGILTGGRALGTSLAAMMGGFFGPLAAIPGILGGLALSFYLY